MQTTPPTNVLRRPVIGRPFGVALGASLAVHAVAVIAYVIVEARRMDVIDLPEEPIKATFVKLGKPRDPKLLPRRTTAPAPRPTPKDNRVAVPTKDAPKEKAVTKEPVEEEEDKKLSAIDRIREQVERDKQREAALNRIAERVGEQEEEEEGQEDGHAQGDTATPSQVNQYLASLNAAVKAHYVVPSVIQPMECVRLTATVMVRMTSDGTVVDVDVHKGSGHDLFDSAVVAAVRKASPLPAPPPNMREMVTKGFGFRFRCNS